MKSNLPSHFRFPLIVVVLVVAVSAGGLIPQRAYAAPGDLFASVNGTTQNGGGSIFQYTPAGAQSAFVSSLDRPRGVLFDNAGNLFVASTTLDNNSGNYQGTIFKVTPGGVVSTFATGFGTNFFLEQLAMDSAGNVFVVADNESDPNLAGTIYKVTPGGTVSPFGLQSDCIQNDGSNCSVPGNSFALAFDSAGNLYVPDSPFQTIYKFTPGGVRSVFAGTVAFSPTQGPVGLAFDRFGNLFASTEDNSGDGNGEILEFAPDGTESTFATGLTNNPRGLAFDSAGNLFVAEFSTPITATTGDILEFTPGGTETVFASGIGRPQGGGGPAFLAFQPLHAIPGDLVASVNGTFPLNGHGLIAQYAPDGTPSTFASSLSRPRGLAFDSAGNFFTTTNTTDDSGNNVATILKFSPGGMVSTFAAGFPSNFFLQGLVTDSAGNAFVMAQNLNDPNWVGTIYKVAPDGTRSTFGSITGQGWGLAFDSSGNLFAADDGDQTGANVNIYKFTPAGVRSIFAGPAAFVSGQFPEGLAVDSSGNLFVSAPGSSSATTAILKFTPDGTESIFATGLNFPRGLAFDGAGNLFVADLVQNGPGTIFEFAPDGTQTVFASGIGRAAGNGGPEYLAFPPGETPVGSNETVNTGTTGSAVVALTFPQVTAGGTTTVTPIDPSSAGTLPSGYALTGSNLAFQITTTATYTPPIIIAFQVPSVDPTTFSQLRIFHNSGGGLVDVTASNPAPDPTTQTIYASVSSLSPFVIAKRIVPTVHVRVQGNQSGPTFTVDGNTYTSAQTFSWASGSSHTIGTTSPESGGPGVQYLWKGWSDSGAISHTVAPTRNTTYTAKFGIQYYLTMNAGTGGKVSPISGWKNSGAIGPIKAAPAKGYSFSNWTGSGTGSYSGTSNPASITINAPLTETATFTH